MFAQGTSSERASDGSETFGGRRESAINRPSNVTVPDTNLQVEARAHPQREKWSLIWHRASKRQPGVEVMMLGHASVRTRHGHFVYISEFFFLFFSGDDATP
jgi:hypothetical protein